MDPLTALEFDLPSPPVNKKNRHMIHRRGSRRWIGPTPEARESENSIAMRADYARRTQGLPVLDDEDVRVEIRHHVPSDTLTVRVEPVGPRPKGKTGRKRDLIGMAETILDAMQGGVYRNDNQVVELVLRRDV